MKNIKRRISLFLHKQKGITYYMKSISDDDKMITLFGISWVALLILMISLKGVFIGFVGTVLISASVSMVAYNLYEFITGRKL